VASLFFITVLIIVILLGRVTCLGRVLARVVRVRLGVMLVRMSAGLLLRVSVMVLLGAGSLYTSISTR